MQPLSKPLPSSSRTNVHFGPSPDTLHQLSLHFRSIIMCKHILNVQAAIRSPCCKKWFDCAECHEEKEDHPLEKATEMAFLCKKCKKAFRKDMTVFEDSDEYCPHCDNHFVVEAKIPHAMVGFEGDDMRVDNRMVKDEREKQKPDTSDIDAFVDQLG